MAGAGLNAMSAHRRPLITAAASGTVLLALWFVPSARAAPDHTAPAALPSTDSVSAPAAAPVTGAEESVGPVPPATGAQLAGTDGPGFMPYVAGGLGLLGLSGALMLRSPRSRAHRRPSPE